eukprot:scaffold1699_cov114-Isochrysis_galbana.AAC.4
MAPANLLATHASPLAGPHRRHRQPVRADQCAVARLPAAAHARDGGGQVGRVCGAVQGVSFLPLQRHRLGHGLLFVSDPSGCSEPSRPLVNGPS